MRVLLSTRAPQLVAAEQERARRDARSGLAALEEQRPLTLPRKRSLECSMCGYGIARDEPPERCPMCQAVGSWAHTPWRPFSDDRLP